MKAKLRRETILKTIQNSKSAISASSLATKFGVSRQIIVGDVALLRAQGNAIESTARGYVLINNNEQFEYIGMIVCKHDQSLTKQELYTIVDFGGVVIDVTVEHSVYGQLTGLLNIHSRHEADLFLEALKQTNDLPLSSISNGIHMHKIGCKNEEIFQLIKEELHHLHICCE